MKTTVVSLLMIAGGIMGASCGHKNRQYNSTTQTQPTAMQHTDQTKPASVYSFTLNDLEGNPVHFEQYRGKLLVLVNVASRCGYTPQYADLEAFYNEYAPKGVVVLGFPANNFGGQEPGTNEDIAAFCQRNYGVSFPMFGKISVKGPDMHPLYQFLTQRSLNGNLDAEVGWNFNKFIVDRNGMVVAHFKSGVKPQDTDFQRILTPLL